MMLTDENGECIETASNLKAKFEALRLLEEAENKKQEQQPAKKFVPKRFKVRYSPYGSENDCLSFDEGHIRNTFHFSVTTERAARTKPRAEGTERTGSHSTVVGIPTSHVIRAEELLSSCPFPCP